MKIIGLDLATHSGWALVENGKVIESGAQDFTKKRGESNGLLFLRGRTWIARLIKDTGAELVAYEQAHYRGGAATEICVGLQTRAQEEAEAAGIISAPFNTSAVKKRAVGKGKASKEEMMDAAEAIIGRPPVTDDEADAIFVALCASDDFEIVSKTYSAVQSAPPSALNQFQRRR